MLRNITDDDLVNLRRWRNLPEVRRVMFSDKIITEKEHTAWWGKIKKDDTKLLLICVLDEIEVGVVNYFDIDKENKTCHWGFYLTDKIDSDSKRLYAWQKIEREAIEYAFDKTGCASLICETFSFNKPTLEMHKRFGFKEISKELRKKNGQNEEVIICTLLQEDYINSHNKILNSKRAAGKKINSSLKDLPFEEYVRTDINVAFLGSSNMDFVSAEFKRIGDSYGVKSTHIKVPFGQYRIEIFTPDSRVRSEKLDYVFFLERLDDLLPGGTVFSEECLDVLQEQWLEYLNIIRESRRLLDGIFIIAGPIAIQSWISGKDPMSKECKNINKSLKAMECQLEEVCAEFPDIYIADFSRIQSRVGYSNSHPSKYWYLARAPFSAEFNVALGLYLIGMILAIEGKTARVLVLDLDNTLWGGVIGEDGLSGLSIGGDYPGNVYGALQAIIKILSRRGFILALCSKNTEEIALNVFQNHSEMLLQKSDFSSWRINWIPKPNNIIEIAQELGVGNGSLCFIDDNLAEREEVRAVLPEVYVPEMPKEISDWPEFILNLPELSTLNLTDEDRKKVDQYRIRSIIQQAESQFDSRETFLESLQMVVSMESIITENKRRIMQLIHKTNQFNTTSNRYAESELEALLENGECFAVRLQDRLGSDEIIGVFILTYKKDAALIDTFLLSCRVLGRGIETVMLAWIVEHIQKNSGIKILSGEIVETPVNYPIRQIYSEHGFNELNNKIFELILENNTIEYPEWIKVE